MKYRFIFFVAITFNSSMLSRSGTLQKKLIECWCQWQQSLRQIGVHNNIRHYEKQYKSLAFAQHKNHPELFTLLELSEISLVEQYLDNHPESLESTNEYGQTPLCVASGIGNVNIVSLLLKKGASPDGFTTLNDTAVIHNQPSPFNTNFMGNSSEISWSALEPWRIYHAPPIIEASKSGNTEIINILLKHGALINVRNHSKNALHCVADDFSADLLIKNGCFLYAHDSYTWKNVGTWKDRVYFASQWQPLHYAIFSRNQSLVKMILSHYDNKKFLDLLTNPIAKISFDAEKNKAVHNYIENITPLSLANLIDHNGIKNILEKFYRKSISNIHW